MLSGTVRTDDHLVNPRSGADERLHGLFRVSGREHEPVDELVAGDIGGVAKLTGTITGDTLAPRGTPGAGGRPRASPEPVLAIAVRARTTADEDKLANALHRLVQEDATLVVTLDPETHQTLLRGTGETHLQVTLERLERKFGVAVDTEEVRVAYRETITQPAEAEGKHKKQSGGHGQFGVATVRIEPLERGAGFEFVDKVVGGAIPRQFIPAVGRGIEEAMAEGGVHGFPVVDVRVTCLDGRYHPVDSSEMSFKMAGRLAFREALAQAAPGGARAGVGHRGHGPGRGAGRRARRPQQPTGSGAGHRGRRAGRAGRDRPGADRRAAALRRRPAVAHRRAGRVLGPPRPLRRGAAQPRRRASATAPARSRRLQRGR